jgi:hypothetical protein
MRLFGRNLVRPQISQMRADLGTGEMPVVRSDELADGDVEGAGDAAEGFEPGTAGVAENAADDGGGDFQTLGQVALVEAALIPRA